MALALSAEDALERVLGGLTEEVFASVRISHSVPGAIGPHVAGLDIIKVVTKTSTSDATQRLDKLKIDYPELFTGSEHFQFPGQGQSRIDVVDLPKMGRLSQTVSSYDCMLLCHRHQAS